MPGLVLDVEQGVAAQPKIPDYGFVVSHQKVELDIDFSTQSLTGRTEITILPLRRDLTEIKIDARQCSIPVYQVMVNGKPASFEYLDPLNVLEIPKHISWTANQYHMQKERLSKLVDEDTRAEGALHIKLPKSVHIEEADSFSDGAANALTQRAVGATIARTSSIALNGIDPLSATPTMTPRTAADQNTRFQPLIITIPFSITNFRDGLHFVGLAETDKRYPHVYTRHSVDPGTASCIFPCIDDPAMRCTWEIDIKCSRTLGDALKRPPVESTHKSHHHHHHHHHHNGKKEHANALTNGVNGLGAEDYQAPLTEEEKLMEMAVICSGEMTDEVIDQWDNSKKTVSFLLTSVVAAQHIGFAIGPFEQIDLSEARDEEDLEKLGQNILPVWGYCLPGRGDEVRNTCFTMAHAVDWFALGFSSFPYSEAKFVFIDDQIRDVEHSAGLSLCSNRLLFPRDIIDTEQEVIRKLAHALATQWLGIHVVPNQATDRWVTIGLSHYMTGLYMKSVFGNNDYQFRQKTLADKLTELDVQRPPIFNLGEYLGVGSFESDFMDLKAPLVLFILDKRIIKASGTMGLTRVISKIVTGANTGVGESTLSTEGFRKLCEKVTKYRQTEPFWNQWVYGAGCPKFSIMQKFNKKRLCVEMKITQKQDAPIKPEAVPPLSKEDFFREFKEDIAGVFATEVQPLFTGPMTIRIHEADGTPYEHIVEIRDGTGSFEIPYNTKYKRLKRTRRQRERLANSGMVGDAEIGEDTLFYCLGDNLSTPKEIKEWGLVDWDPEMLAKMEGESYEWIRVDADFEWLCTKEFIGGMPGYMYMSQLQQDRDVVAQQESMLWLKSQQPHPLAATFLIRTLMDTRYFHGIRSMAAEILPTHAVPRYNWIGFTHLEKAFSHFWCYPGTKTPRPNDFTNKAAYSVMKSITKAVAQVRGPDGLCPKPARQFILDQLRFNDNGQNEYSDFYKVAGLLSAAAECLIPKKKNKDEVLFNDDDENDEEPKQFRDMVIDEIDRYRRMDEWSHTYNNIYTVTALDCKQKLMKAGIIPVDPVEFVKYIHDGTAELIQFKAFESLLDLGFMTNGALVTYLLNVASTDSSPYVRHRLYEELCLGLAVTAFGDGPNKAAEAPAADAVDFLIVEEDSGLNEARKDHIERTTDIDGALKAVKKELEENIPLKEALWKAIKSPKLDLFEQSDLLDVCEILYKPGVDSMTVDVKLPRYWECENLGKVQMLNDYFHSVVLTIYSGNPQVQTEWQDSEVKGKPQSFTSASIASGRGTSSFPWSCAQTLLPIRS
jgi:transcription initiation factor TFIID subunit 2